MSPTAIFANVALVALLASCGSGDERATSEVGGYDALVLQVERNRIGRDPDHWIEMENLAGEWERTGLIFGYLGDYDECLKAVAGLKQTNYAREYRCVPAN